MAKTGWDTGVGKGAVNGGWVAVLGIGFAGLSVLLLYAVLAFWPPTPNPDVTPPPDYAPQFFSWQPTVSREQGLLLIVALAGGLGAMGHVLRSFSRYVGERHLVWSWVPSYLLTPLVGALFATITYILIRAGLITGSAATEGSAFGFVAVAALVGLFSAQAAAKLKDVFETIFAKVEAGKESIAAAGEAPAIESFSPSSGRAGAEVEIAGSGLEEVTAVAFGGGVSADAAFDRATGTLRTKVPPGAESGPLAVTAGSATTTSEESFTVEA